MQKREKSGGKRRPLYVATITFYLGMATCLILFGWRVAWQNQQNYALTEAVSRRDLRTIGRLLREGADPNAPWSGYRLRDQIGRLLKREPWTQRDPSILEWVQNDAEMTRLLSTPVSDLPGDEELAYATERSHQEALLFMAAARGDNETIRVLIERDLSIDARDPNGRTPLIYAVNARQTATVKFLLKRGADVHARTCDGRSVLANALMYGDARLCSPLLQAGARVNVQDNFGNTPLIEAARNGDLARVRELLQHGADPNLRPVDGPGPLDWALLSSNPDVVTELRRAGARRFRQPLIRF